MKGADRVKTIKYVGFNDSTGYSIAAKNLVASLKQESVTVHWTPVAYGTSANNPDSVQQITEGYENVIVHLVPEYYPKWVEFERSHYAKSKKIWGYTTWETDKIPIHWKDLLNIMDGIFVPCEWNRDVFHECGVKTRIEILPHISQFQGMIPVVSPSPEMQKLTQRTGKRFVFYNIGIWSERKAPWLLIKTFLSEFKPEEPVVLIIKTGKDDFANYRRKWSKPWQFVPGKAATAFKTFMKAAPIGPEVIHLDEEMSDNDIAWLHKTGDCFISLSHGEGWGLGSYEASWFGKPIITTGIGGVLDYLLPDFSYHVNYELTPVHYNEHWASYTNDQRWAEPDLTHARQLMRQVFEDAKGAAEKGIHLSEYVKNNFSSIRIAKQCLDSLEKEK
jgi:glycosyltransferase involved in cell wall biosynthesis